MFNTMLRQQIQISLLGVISEREMGLRDYAPHFQLRILALVLLLGSASTLPVGSKKGVWQVEFETSNPKPGCVTANG
jgi:hypothetical protein